MSKLPDENVTLNFPLIVADDWPPVSLECLPFRRRRKGYELLTAPLFVKDLSVGDIIDVVADAEDNVESWRHLSRSNRTTVWLLRMKHSDNLAAVLAELRRLGCNTVGQESLGSYAADIPDDLSLSDVDAVLDKLDSNEIAVAFPSIRHPD